MHHRPPAGQGQGAVQGGLGERPAQLQVELGAALGVQVRQEAVLPRLHHPVQEGLEVGQVGGPGQLQGHGPLAGEGQVPAQVHVGGGHPRPVSWAALVQGVGGGLGRRGFPGPRGGPPFQFQVHVHAGQIALDLARTGLDQGEALELAVEPFHGAPPLEPLGVPVALGVERAAGVLQEVAGEPGRQLGRIGGIGAQVHREASGGPVRALLHRLQVHQFLGLPGQPDMRLEPAALEQGRGFQALDGLVPLGDAAPGDLHLAGRDADGAQRGGVGPVQVHVHLGLEQGPGQSQQLGIHPALQVHLPGFLFQVHVQGALEGQRPGGSARVRVQVLLGVRHPHAGDLQPFPVDVHGEVRLHGRHLQAEHLALLGLALTLHEDVVERPVQAHGAAAHAVHRQVPQVRGPQPFPDGQARGLVGHVDLVAALGQVRPGEPQVPGGAAVPFAQGNIRHPQHVPVDAHRGRHAIRPGSVPAGLFHVHLAAELDAGARLPAEAAGNLGAASHVQGRQLSGRALHADPPGQEHSGHVPGVRAQVRLRLHAVQPVPSQDAGRRALEGQFGQVQLHLGDPQPAFLQVRRQAAHLPVPLQELAGGLAGQVLQSGQGPGHAAGSGRQLGLPGKLRHQPLEELRPGPARRRGHGDVPDLGFQPVAIPGGPGAGCLRLAVRAGPFQVFQAHLPGPAPGREGEPARLQGQPLGAQALALQGSGPVQGLRGARRLALEIHLAPGLRGPARPCQALGLHQVQVPAGGHVDDVPWEKVGSLETQAIVPQPRLAPLHVHLAFGQVGGHRQVPCQGLPRLAQDHAGDPQLHPHLVGHHAPAGHLEVEIPPGQAPGGFPHLHQAVPDLQPVQAHLRRAAAGGCSLRRIRARCARSRRSTGSCRMTRQVAGRGTGWPTPGPLPATWPGAGRRPPPGRAAGAGPGTGGSPGARPVRPGRIPPWPGHPACR